MNYLLYMLSNFQYDTRISYIRLKFSLLYLPLFEYKFVYTQNPAAFSYYVPTYSGCIFDYDLYTYYLEEPRYCSKK